MNEYEFETIFDQLMLQLERWLEANSDDIDVERDQGRLKVIIDDAHIILSRQTAIREVWLAAPSGAYHFQLKTNRWLTNKNEELIAVLASVIETASGLQLDQTLWETK